VINDVGKSNELAGDPSPVPSANRISSLDVIRGTALLGILLLNIIGFGLPHAYTDPTNYGGAEGWNLLVWQTNALFFEGTMRGLFSMLFGAGVVLMTARAEERGGGIEVADIYFRRNLWLIAFGVVHAWLLLWPGEILYIYGIAALFLFVFRRVKPRSLVVLGILILSTTVAKDTYFFFQATAEFREAQAAQSLLEADEAVDDDQQQAIDAWQERVAEQRPPAEEIEELIELKKGSYFDNIAANTEPNINRQSSRLYMYSLWDALGFMLIGMALLKLGVLNADRSGRFYLALMVLGYGVGTSVNYYEMRLLAYSNFDPVALSQSWLTYDIGRLPTTLGHIGLVMTICKRGWLRWLTSRLAAVGRMALTNYIMHTVICVFVFTGLGLGLYSELQRYELYYVVFGIWVFQLIVSPIWLAHYQFGPLEWLWRSLTYKKRQPMRITEIQSTAAKPA
jgi:uncharacterized protein